MEKIKTYKDLKIWQKAYEVGIRIIRIAGGISRNSRSTGLVLDQIVRSSTSVCANIAEGYGSDSNPEFARFLGIAYKSALETDNWLQILKSCTKECEDKLKEIETDNLACIKMLLSPRKKIKQSVDKNRF